MAHPDNIVAISRFFYPIVSLSFSKILPHLSKTVGGEDILISIGQSTIGIVGLLCLMLLLDKPLYSQTYSIIVV